MEVFKVYQQFKGLKDNTLLTSSLSKLQLFITSVFDLQIQHVDPALQKTSNNLQKELSINEFNQKLNEI